MLFGSLKLWILLVFMFFGFWKKNIITKNKYLHAYKNNEHFFKHKTSKMGFKNKSICIFDLKDFSSVNPSVAILLFLSPGFDFEEKIWHFKEMYSFLS